MKKVSILVPCYDEEESLPLFHSALLETLEPIATLYDFEFIYINDGSHDGTLSLLQSYRAEDKRVNYIDMSRNFGKEIGMLAGMDYFSGDCLVIIDADLQEPPSAIIEMLQRWEEGYDDVYGRRRERQQSYAKRCTSKLYHKLLGKISDTELETDSGDFRLLDRKCVEALRSLRETQRYTKGLYNWIGFNKCYVDYDIAPRAAGKTKWHLTNLVRLALDGITSHSLVPLRLASYIGIVVSISAFIYFFYVVIKAMIYGDPVAGYPSMMAVLLFLGGMILLSLGIIGEYLGRVFMETKRRPPYILKSINGQQQK
jgi:glycosyltransferase involved in cell wall biosynthesis